MIKTRRSYLGLPATRGFTLIELLVVIAIIAILAAILFPIFARAKEASKKAACTSNINQISKAMKMYMMDYDGHYTPWRLKKGAIESMDVHWPVALFSYSKERKIFVCPSDSKPRIERDLDRQQYPLSYGINYWLHHKGEYSYTQEIIDKVFRNYGGMGQCPVFAECTHFHFADNGDRLLKAARHNGGLNISFADGHTAYMKAGVVESMLVWPSEAQ